jgi:hypothetical protein
VFISKESPSRYWINMYELCDAKSGYIYNLEVGTVAHPTNPENNTAFSVVDRLCDKREGSLCVQYMDRWFSSPKIFNHSWGCKTKAVSTVMSNQKKSLNKYFLEN